MSHPNFDTYGFGWPGGPDYEPPPPPRCGYCGGFLPWTPDRQTPWEEKIECDGSATQHMVTPEGELRAIIGPEPYPEWWSACGSAGGDHAPHTEIMAAGYTFYWDCPKCGKEYKETA